MLSIDTSPGNTSSVGHRQDLLDPALLKALDGFVDEHDPAHVLRFCGSALDGFEQEVAEFRIGNMMALFPESVEYGSKAAKAARTQYAIRVIEQLAGYGIHINSVLNDTEVQRGREIVRLCFAFPERWSSLDPSGADRDDDLIRFIGCHTDDVDAIIDACALDDALLSVEYLHGYLDMTSPPLRDGYL